MILINNYSSSIDYEGERNICFSKIQLVGQRNIENKHLSQVKAGHQSFFTAKISQIWWALFATSGLQHIAKRYDSDKDLPYFDFARDRQ